MVKKEKNSFDVQSLQQTFWKKVVFFWNFGKGNCKNFEFLKHYQPKPRI